MNRRSSLLLAMIACVAIFAVAGCGKSSSNSTSSQSGAPAAAETTATTSTTKFAKTKFVLHAGLALGAFHHFIYKPLKEGDFKHPFLHKAKLLKAGLAGLFTYHELKLAAEDTKSSKLLSTLFSPITLVANKLASLKSGVTSGKVSPSDLEGVDTELGQISSSAASKGSPVSESVPSVSQLASPSE